MYLCTRNISPNHARNTMHIPVRQGPAPLFAKKKINNAVSASPPAG